ncbi:MAG: SPOR domain-containing protein, partial [Bacteroidetes bacterium]
GYLDFTAPNYTVRLGDFTNKEGATDVMKQVRTQFIGAFVVPDQVYVNRQLPQESQTEPGTGSGNEK